MVFEITCFLNHNARHINSISNSPTFKDFHAHVVVKLKSNVNIWQICKQIVNGVILVSSEYKGLSIYIQVYTYICMSLISPPPWRKWIKPHGTAVAHNVKWCTGCGWISSNNYLYIWMYTIGPPAFKTGSIQFNISGNHKSVCIDTNQTWLVAHMLILRLYSHINSQWL